VGNLEVTMEFSRLVRARRSVRAFSEQAIEPEKVRVVIEAAISAPSAGNLQAYEIFNVITPRIRGALAHASDQSFVAQAPVCLVFVSNPGRSARKYGARGRELYALQDATIAASYAQLAATDLGLASVWVGAFDDDAVASALGIPGDWAPVAILPLGYPMENPEPANRRPLEEVVHVL
jgi:nitroreductase